MTSLSPPDNATVWGTVQITGSGVGDNVGVVKGELEIDGQFVSPTRRTSAYADFAWDTTGTSDGPHAIKVTVYDAALNERALTSSVWVANQIKNRMDGDHDGDVDMSDFGFFQACFNGPNRPAAIAGCEGTDFDSDTDCDLTDFAAFQFCFNGPNRPAACP
jgi:hypothetical protein